MEPVRWGVISTAKIGLEKVIPAMQGAEGVEIVAIASRDAARAEQAAARLGIARAHGSYEALLSDPDVEAVYNPLPNHLHVPLTEQAAKAGDSQDTIAAAVARINDMSVQIASSAEQQSAVSEEINRNIVHVNEMAGQSRTLA